MEVQPDFRELLALFRYPNRANREIRCHEPTSRNRLPASRLVAGQ